MHSTLFAYAASSAVRRSGGPNSRWGEFLLREDRAIREPEPVS
jgi:hypothetical protein